MPTAFDEVACLHRLVEGDALLALLTASGVAVRAVRPTYVRIKPGTGVLIALELTPASGTALPLLGYVRAHAPERARELAAKWQGGRAVSTPLGEGVRLLDGGGAVLFVFPNDAEVRGLRFVAEPDKLKRLLGELPAIGGEGFRVRGRASTFTRVRYKPERRLIVRADLALRHDVAGVDAARSVFVRFFTDARGARLAHLTAALRAQGLADLLPAPLGAVADGRLFVEAAVAGEDLCTRVVDGGGDADAVAAALARLHGVAVDGLADVTPSGALAHAHEGLATFAHAVSDLAPLLREVGAALDVHRPAAPANLATVHGDCHLHQFLAHSAGVALVDFERTARGDPAFDLGHLCAHAQSVDLRALAPQSAARTFAAAVVERYRRLAPHTELSALPFYTACGLLDRALLPFRHLEVDWRAQTERLLRAALAALASASPAHGSPAHGSPAPARAPTFFAARRGVFHPNPGDGWPGYVQASDGTREYGVYDVARDHFVAVDPRRDAALPALPALLEQGELVAYRAGRRATVRRRDGGSFVKVLPPAKVAAIASRWRAAAEAAAVQPTLPRVPMLLAVDRAAGTLCTAPLQGVSLHDLAPAATDWTDELCVRLAVSVAALHGSALELAPTPAPRSPAAWLSLLRPHDPALAEAATRLLVVWDQRGPWSVLPAVVHGDLHDRNVYVSDMAVGLLDLDGLAQGDAHDDIGNLAAHVVLRAHERGQATELGAQAAERLLRAYCRQVVVASLTAARQACARTLWRLACVYRFRTGGPTLAPALLEAAEMFAEFAHTERV